MLAIERKKRGEKSETSKEIQYSRKQNPGLFIVVAYWDIWINVEIKAN